MTLLASKRLGLFEMSLASVQAEFTTSPAVKQILTARECASLNKRMRMERMRGEPYFRVQQHKQRPCIMQDQPPLHVVYVTCFLGNVSGEGWVMFQPNTRESAKIVRRYLLDSLPEFPYLKAAPYFDGFAAEPDFWYEITQSNGVLNCTEWP